MLERSPDPTYFKAVRQPVELVSLGVLRPGLNQVVIRPYAVVLTDLFYLDPMMICGCDIYIVTRKQETGPHQRIVVIYSSPL